MTSRERVLRTLLHQRVDRVARELSIAPRVEAERPDEVAELLARFPSDIVRVEADPPPTRRPRARGARDGEACDAWGCVWSAPGDDRAGQLTASPLAEVGKIASYRPPAELLKKSRFEQASRAAAATSRFALAHAASRPLDRLCFLRGPEAALADLARGAKELRTLAGVLHDFACQEMRAWAAADVDAVAIHDDWGTPDGLATGLDVWRDVFRPMYREYVEILHAGDKFVFLRTAGNVSSLLGELVKLGVDAVQLDFDRLDPERVAKKYRGRITFWGDSALGPRVAAASADELRAMARRRRTALDAGEGGVVASCRWAPGAPLRNLIAFFECWAAPLSSVAGPKPADQRREVG